MTGAARLVLASGSPRRSELLRGLGLDFSVRAADLDETALPAEPPRRTVERLAREKAQAAAAAADAGDREVILAADTVVVLDDALLGKPRDPSEARSMLRRLAGREHRVYTGVALLDRREVPPRGVSAVAATAVHIAPLDDEIVDWYVATGEPLDKAGAYGVQGLGAWFVDRVHGNYTNVVGLPLPLVVGLLARLGLDWRSFRRAGRRPG